MSDEKTTRTNIIKNKIPIQLIGCIVLIIIAVMLLLTKNLKSGQSSSAMYPKVIFEGEYSIEEGQWQPVIKGEHIPASKGDVTLRGKFHMVTQTGEYIAPIEAGTPIAFFLDHINLKIYENGVEPHIVDIENPMFGIDTCGQCWIGYALSKGSEEDVELVFHNPHRFGNETAIDDCLKNLSTWLSIDFEKDILKLGNAQRYAGMLFSIVAMIILGIALFSSLFRIRNSHIIWMIGGAIVFAGIYFIYSGDSISFWSASFTSNTIILGASMMFYMLFLLGSMTAMLTKTKKLGVTAVTALGVADALFFLFPMLTKVTFYDTWFYWIIIQTIGNSIFVYCFIKEFIGIKNYKKWSYAGLCLPLISFELDVIATMCGMWKGGLISKYVFIVIFFAALVVILQIIPKGVITSLKAKELEAEKNALDVQLAESRISTMISQIRPHFIYNTLGSIEQLCELDPPKAAELVHNFAKYLRGNFSELDNPKTIRMSQEMEHVKYYISIENVRFPDMVFTFEMNSGDFKLPALTIQPIIENAIKHGLMKLQKGGSIHVTSYETESHYCVSVVDDGVGFDTSILHDERKHIGLRNIRGRLEAMVSGTLEIESKIGEGTKVLIKIPKETV